MHFNIEEGAVLLAPILSRHGIRLICYFLRVSIASLPFDGAEGSHGVLQNVVTNGQIQVEKRMAHDSAQ